MIWTCTVLSSLLLLRLPGRLRRAGGPASESSGEDRQGVLLRPGGPQPTAEAIRLYLPSDLFPVLAPRLEVGHVVVHLSLHSSFSLWEVKTRARMGASGERGEVARGLRRRASLD